MWHTVSDSLGIWRISSRPYASNCTRRRGTCSKCSFYWKEQNTTRYSTYISKLHGPSCRIKLSFRKFKSYLSTDAGKYITAFKKWCHTRCSLQIYAHDATNEFKWWRFVVIGPEVHVASDFVRHLLWLIGDNVVVVLDEFELDDGKMSRLHAMSSVWSVGSGRWMQSAESNQPTTVLTKVPWSA